MPDEDEITRPGTPDSLRSMHEIQGTMRSVLGRLNAICDSLDRIENAVKEAVRDSRTAKADAARAFATAREAAHASRFTDKRIDVMLARLQAVENGQR